MSIVGKVALITGASSGIGEATAVLFAQNGAKLCLASRNEQQLNRVLSKCMTPSNHIVVPTDCTDLLQLKQLIDRCTGHFGRLDILVNNAGKIGNDTIESVSMDKFDQMMNLNLRAPLYLMNLAVPHLANSQGSIVNVSSITGTRAFPNVLSYCISKGALDQLTRCAALELGPKQIRVNSVNPGLIVTELHRNSGMLEESYQQFLERGKQVHPLRRNGEAREVAETVLFLADSNRSGFITGEMIHVDGGKHGVCPR